MEVVPLDLLEVAEAGEEAVLLCLIQLWVAEEAEGEQKEQICLEHQEVEAEVMEVEQLL